MTGPRVFFYVQHLLGIGHLARASHIARALAGDGFDVTMVIGGMPVPGFPDPSLKTFALPALTSGDQEFSGLTDADGRPVDEAFKARRRDALLAAFQQVRPDIVIIEAFPFGRRQMRFELMPLLDAVAAAEPRPLLVTSVRDILQERVKPGRNEETVEIVRRAFDLVMVHGDPGFATLEETFPLAPAIVGKVAYTGLVAAPPPGPAADRFDVLISAGGGAAGAGLVQAAAAASHFFPGQRWGLITGPNLARDNFEAAERDAASNLEIFRFRKDFASLLCSARLSVSQAGYNTVCDILNAGCRALLVPFSAGGETEQGVRAGRLERLGLASVLEETEIGPSSLTAAIGAALAGGKPPPFKLQLDGARQTAALLRERLRQFRSA